MVAIRPGTSGIVAAAAAFSSAFSSSVAGCGSLGAGSSYANAAASSFGAGAGGRGCTLSPVAATLILSTGAAGP